jgi:hypothetical protein
VKTSVDGVHSPAEVDFRPHYCRVSADNSPTNNLRRGSPRILNLDERLYSGVMNGGQQRNTCGWVSLGESRDY